MMFGLPRPDYPMRAGLYRQCFAQAPSLTACHRPSQIFGNQFEFLERTARRSGGLQRPFQAIADVIMNQGFLGALYRALDRLQLLGNLQTWSVILDHFDDGLKVTVGTLEPSDDRGVILVRHVLSNPVTGTL
jgi:hypothetical protein